MTPILEVSHGTLVIASSRGGDYNAGSPAAAFDHQETYLKTALGFLGITDITFIRPEGVAMVRRHAAGPSPRQGKRPPGSLRE